uniref:NAD(P)H oxidase (H2O2-forming) n=1 Tax=Dendroctonus ponderosae TaxID=77166 RepID=A0AAR5PYW1_DENPD
DPAYSRIEKQRYDGWFNNLAHPEWGSVDSHLIRRAPPAYSDGVYMLSGQNRPSPRKLSRLFMKGIDGLASLTNRTALLAFFGQLVTSEVVMASESGCPIEMHHIEIEKCDEMYDKECKGNRYIPFHRASYDRETGQSPNSPREQVNRASSWIDGSFIYSSSEPWTNAMRSFVNGSFLTDATGKMPLRNYKKVPLFNSPAPHMMKMQSTEKLFMLGDPRTNQNPALLTLGILFFRWHNVMAERIQRTNPAWSDEDVFQKARRVVVATLQNIVLYEYLPAFLGEALPQYTGYQQNVHPGITHVFQSAAFRFGHSLIPPGLYRRDSKCNFKKTPMGHLALRLCSTWWDSNEVLTNNSIEELLMGMASQLAEKEDSVLCSDVRDKLFGPMEFSRRDLGALNIMRGRDNGLPDYNTVRAFYGLSRRSNWTEINPALFKEKPQLLDTLANVYANNIDNVDVYVGGMLESLGHPGELFRTVIKEQFVRLRDSDRFWFENEANGVFTKLEIEEMRKVSLWDVIVNSTFITPGAIQRSVFFWNDGDPCAQPMQLNVSLMEPCQMITGYDYFEGNELVYIYACVFLGFVPIVCAGAGYGVVKLQNRRRRRLKIKQQELQTKNCKLAVETMMVHEWLHANHKRLVKIKFGPEAVVHIIGRKGESLRVVNFKNIESVVVEESLDVTSVKKPMILVHVQRDHDLVLEFESVGSKKKFISKLELFLNSNKKSLLLTQVVREIMLAKAETKQRREKKLEHFFREAYALTFGLRPGEKRRGSNDTTDGEVNTSFFYKLLFGYFASSQESMYNDCIQWLADYSFMAEHTDLRHIMGVGIAITRGSAASLSFCYSILLLTMSRNLITKLKEFSIQQYIPLDANIQFHKIAACTALFFSVLHTVGHIVNFYHVSTQPVENLKCLTSEIRFPSDYKPGISFWLFQTLTGLSGVLLFVIMCVIIVFAHPTIRKKAYKFFWFTHSLYVLLYALCLVHGLARLTGAPRFWMFFLGPGIVFTLDKVVSMRTRYIPLDVLETELLPSDVIKIKFYRPPNLKYLSGQWVRLACTAFKDREFHSFTLTSAPHENFLSCHIKAQGPWTWKLRNYFDPCNYNLEDQPKILLEGPFGGGNQDWYKFEVAVMVGGGIGVTPYASILNDLVFGTSTNRYSGVACKKVYFLWICPSHKHFEWFIDVLRDVEKKDVTNVLEIHIFITQFFHKFDLRTTMLYICENHFQRLSKTSIFTGLKAVNHFGRPDMTSFLKFVQKRHSYVSKIGVFSCGPRPLTKSVMSACDEVNMGRKLPYFIHHFENFG